MIDSFAGTGAVSITDLTTSNTRPTTSTKQNIDWDKNNEITISKLACTQYFCPSNYRNIAFNWIVFKNQSARSNCILDS